jgi:anti-sigma-K factor RskA
MALHDMLATADFRDAENARELAELRKIAMPIMDPAAERVTLVAAKTPPQPQGKAYYMKNRSGLVFMASNMPPLPSEKAYELWLIPMTGSPIPAGMFKPDARGNATVVNPPLPAGVEAKAFAVTMEDEAGSPAPTSPVLMSGAGE